MAGTKNKLTDLNDHLFMQLERLGDEVFIGQSSEPGALVCDPFFGSGSVAVACQRLGRRFIGSDINPKALEYYQGRTETQAGLF